MSDKPIYPSTYGWARIDHESQIIEKLMKMGAVVINPRKKGAGFSRERTS